MSELPSKPCVVRPSLPKGDEVPNGAGLRPVSRMRSAGKGFLGSMGIHLALIAAACSITLVGKGGSVQSVGSSYQKDDGFQMTMAHDALSSADQPPTFPVAAALPLVAATRSTVELPVSTPIPDLPKAAAAVLQQPSDSPPTNPASAKTSAGPASKAAKPGRGTGSDEGRMAKRERPAPPPKLLRAPPPRYPAAARAAGKSGTVSVLVRVRSNGSAASTSLYKGCGNGQLDQAAVEAARSWSFSPTPLLGPDASIPVVVQVNFTL